MDNSYGCTTIKYHENLILQNYAPCHKISKEFENISFAI